MNKGGEQGERRWTLHAAALIWWGWNGAAVTCTATNVAPPVGKLMKSSCVSLSLKFMFEKIDTKFFSSFVLNFLNERIASPAVQLQDNCLFVYANVKKNLYTYTYI